MNQEETGDGIGKAGINIYWPETSNQKYIKALEDATKEYSLNNISPDIIIGEGPSGHLNYYHIYFTITQNSARNIIFKNENGLFIIDNNTYWDIWMGV